VKSWLRYGAFVVCLLLSACAGGPSESEATHAHGAKKPALDIKWEVRGSTLSVDVETDLHVSSEHYGQGRKDGEGHIHMYLDNDEKITVTETHKEFPNLPAGKHTLKVSLHNNDHTPYDVTKTISFEIR